MAKEHKEDLITDQSEFLEIKERIEKLETRLEAKESFQEKEKAVKEEIKKYIEETQETPAFASSPATRDEAKEISRFEPSQQIGALVSLVFEKSLSEAVSVARSLDNPAILDEFHDILVDRYYKIMVEKGALNF